MKKFLTICSLIIASAVMLSAQDIAPGEYEYTLVDTSKETPYEVVSLTFWYDTPTASNYTVTYGLKAGAPFGVGAPVYGLEIAILGALSDVVYGAQVGLVMCKAEEISGLQVSAFNMATEMTGLQLGVINYAKEKSFQIGFLNYLEESSLFPFMPIINFKF